MEPFPATCRSQFVRRQPNEWLPQAGLSECEPKAMDPANPVGLARAARVVSERLWSILKSQRWCQMLLTRHLVVLMFV